MLAERRKHPRTGMRKLLYKLQSSWLARGIRIGRDGRHMPVLLALAFSLTLLLLSRLFPYLAQRLTIIHHEEDGLHMVGVVSSFFPLPCSY